MADFYGKTTAVSGVRGRLVRLDSVTCFCPNSSKAAAIPVDGAPAAVGGKGTRAVLWSDNIVTKGWRNCREYEAPGTPITPPSCPTFVA